MTATLHRIRRVRAGTVDTSESVFHDMQPQTTHEQEDGHYDELGNQDEAEASRPWPPLSMHRQHYTPAPVASPWRVAAMVGVLVAIFVAFALQYFGVLVLP